MANGPDDFFELAPEPGRLLGLPFPDPRFIPSDVQPGAERPTPEFFGLAPGQGEPLPDVLAALARLTEAVPELPPVTAAEPSVLPGGLASVFGGLFGNAQAFPRNLSSEARQLAPQAPTDLPSPTVPIDEQAPVEPPPPSQLPVAPQADPQTELAARIEKLISDSVSDASRSLNQEAQITDYIDTVREAQAAGVDVVPSFGNTGAPGEFQVTSDSYGPKRRGQAEAEAARRETALASPSERELASAEAGHQAAVEALAAFQAQFSGQARPIAEQLALVDQAMASPDLTPGGRQQAARVRQAMANQLQLAAAQDKATLDRQLAPLRAQLEVAQQRLQLARDRRREALPVERARELVAGIPQQTLDAWKVAAGTPGASNAAAADFAQRASESARFRQSRIQRLGQISLADAFAAEPGAQAQEDGWWQQMREQRRGNEPLPPEEQALVNQMTRLKQTAWRSPQANEAVEQAAEQRQIAVTELSDEERAAAQRSGALAVLPELIFANGMQGMLRDNPALMAIPGHEGSEQVVARYEELARGPAGQGRELNDLFALFFQAASDVLPPDGRQNVVERMLQTFATNYNTTFRQEVGATFDVSKLKAQAVQLGVRQVARQAREQLLGQTALGPAAPAEGIPETAARGLPIGIQLGL